MVSHRRAGDDVHMPEEEVCACECFVHCLVILRWLKSQTVVTVKPPGADFSLVAPFENLNWQIITGAVYFRIRVA